MSFPIKGVGGVPGQSGLEQLQRPTDGTVEAEKARLAKATKEFESFFVYQMLKGMRKTVPDNPLSGGGGMSGGLGKDTFTDMMDMEVARKSSLGGHNSISKLLYNATEKLIDARYEQRPDKPELAPLRPAPSGPLPLNPTRSMPLSRPEPIPLAPRPNGDGLPLTSVRRQVTEDPVLARFGSYIMEASRESKVDSALIAAVIRVESNGDPKAESPAGAKGLMQLIDSTAKELNVSDSFDPRENVMAGARYLRRMLDRFGDLRLALAAYNAGPGNVVKHGGVPPFEETRNYVDKVCALVRGRQAK